MRASAAVLPRLPSTSRSAVATTSRSGTIARPLAVRRCSSLPSLRWPAARVSSPSSSLLLSPSSLVSRQPSAALHAGRCATRFFSSTARCRQTADMGGDDRYTVRLGSAWRGTGTDFDPQSSSIESRILAASLPHVLTHGWTTAALGEGAKSLDLSSASNGLFPRGGIELVEYFVRRTTGEVREDMEKMDLQNMKVTAKVRAGVLMRLERLKPFISKWPEALALMAQPQNAPNALLNLGELVDEIWFVAGDRSHDMNWYSKRALLAGVYTSTELFMTQDRSPDYSQTEKFLDRRLQDVAFIGRTANEVSNLVTFGVRSAQGILASRGIHLFK
ncbi:COQ9-domain-containing protein [Zopfochytrium polystomum]|nr:COQ9-domain-containing protein [Zopfochytrium polystomum]